MSDFTPVDSCSYIDLVITDEDIELLKSGKILEFNINDEYDCAMAYSKGEKQ